METGTDRIERFIHLRAARDCVWRDRLGEALRVNARGWSAQMDAIAHHVA